MPRCKNCREKFEAKYFNQKFCLKNECANASIEFKKALNSIKQISDKRKEQNKVYSELRKRYLRENPNCESTRDNFYTLT